MKKIISLAIAIIIAFSFLAFPFVVSADDEEKMTTQEYYSSQAYLFTQLKDKKIDYPTYSERSKAVTDKYISDNTIIDDIGEHLGNGAKYASDKIGALGQKIGDTIGKYGNAVYDYLSSLGAGLLDGYTVQNQVPTTDLKGYGALHEAWRSDGTISYRYYCDYIVLNDVTNMFHGKLYCVYYDSDGKILREENRDMGDSFASITRSPFDKNYGDVRNYRDGTQAPTDDTFETIIDYDFTQATEKELEDLMKDLLNEFELQMPDLSSIEGLLNAIYARLGTLDSDNDNSLLSDINSSIQSLNSSISEVSNNIETSINDLKETVSSIFSDEDDDTDNDTVKHEIAGTLYNVIPLEKNWLRKFSDTVFDNKANLKVEYEGKVYYLEDDGTLKLGDKYYKVDMNYSSTLDEILDTLLDIRDSVSLLTEEEKKMSFDDFFDLKLTDLKSDFDENFAFKDNIKDFLSNIFYEFEKAVPKYESGDE